MFKCTSEANVDEYLPRYKSIEMESSETVMSYVSKLLELENKFGEIGCPINDKEKCWALLRGLKEEYKVIAEVVGATNKSPSGAISLLVVQEAAIKKKESKQEVDSAFIINK